MQSGFMDKKAGFEGEWDDPDIGGIDGKDDGDKTWDPGGRSRTNKNKSGYDCGGSRSIRKGTDLGVEDFGCRKSSFGYEEVDC